MIDLPIPVPTDDEVLVQVKAMSLCNQHDLKVNQGLYQDLAYLEYGTPGFPGHEGAGIITAVGTHVTDYAIGDHVVMSGLGGPPLYTEYVTRKPDLIVPVRKDIPFEQVAMSELFGCVHRACRKVPTYDDKSVVVSGCGAAGLAAIQLVRAFGARQVTAVDTAAERLSLARELGADAVVNATDSEALQNHEQVGADIVIECSGHKAAYRSGCHIAREALVIFGYSEGLVEIPLWPLFDHETTIYNSKWLTNDDLGAVVRMIESGQIRTEKMISLRMDLAQYPDAVEKVARGDVIKAILTNEP